VLSLALLCGWAGAADAGAVVNGISGTSFSLTAGPASINTPDGDSVLIWAYGVTGSPVQYPGPTLIVTQGSTVTVTLTNPATMTQNVSIVFPGQGEVTATGGVAGLLTREATPGGGAVTYSFVASQAGTYLYHSGTRPELQVEMGLLGVIIVRPTGFNPAAPTAYGHPSTAYDHEYLFVLSEMDPTIHDLVDFGFSEFVDNTTFFSRFWFINGRNGMDTLMADGVSWLPNQPYGALARTRPGERVLIRLVSAGRDQHAFHPHGAHSLLIARDGRMLSSGPGMGADLGTANFTFTPTPGSTMDAIFTWTSKGLGWDIYGDPAEAGFEHDCTPAGPGNPIDAATGEDCTYHGVRLDSKVVLPGLQDVHFGGWYSGSPFLGYFGELPPGEGGLNLNGGLFFMWHSHNEKELTNFDIFPGGMLTFVVIEPPSVDIP
jgi:FtsP/CotA-like multicopper oxidase with cupredoxin domain